jgi:hypothetical protein
VANAVNQKPKALSEFRDDVPPGLERIVSAASPKNRMGRYPDYQTLRNALTAFQLPKAGACIHEAPRLCRLDRLP